MWWGHFSCLVIKGGFWSVNLSAREETVERDKQAKSLIMRKIFWEITCQTRHFKWAAICLDFHFNNFSRHSSFKVAFCGRKWKLNFYSAKSIHSESSEQCANYPLTRDLCLALNLWIVLLLWPFAKEFSYFLTSSSKRERESASENFRKWKWASELNL